MTSDTETTDTATPEPMALSELIGALEAADPATVVPDGFRMPHSYRGYYAELAFEPAMHVTVAQMLAHARDALGSTYEGWKGGYFTMTEDTPCWVAFEGACGEELTADRLRDMLAAGHGRDGQTVERLRAELDRCRAALEEIKLRTVQRDLSQIARAALDGTEAS